jgi:hypothetical protein
MRPRKLGLGGRSVDAELVGLGIAPGGRNAIGSADMRFKAHLVLLASLLLGACASPPLMIPVASAGLDLAPITLVEVEPDVRQQCELSIHQALHRHGFATDRAGAHVQVEVAFFPETVHDAPADEFPDSIHAAFTPGSSARPPGFTAELTATILIGGKVRKVLGSGTAMRVERFRNLAPNGAPSRIAACAIGAERLVTALVEEMNHAAR